MLNNKARSFVTIMLVISACALLIKAGLSQVIKASIAQNESNAQATLKLISTALENYENLNGNYPADLSVLLRTDPPYLDRNYIEESPIRGYNYSCERLEAASYSCSASPYMCEWTGKRSFTVTTGGPLTAEDCSKKD